MTNHFHTDVIAVLFSGLSAILVINLLRILTGHLAKGEGFAATIGRGVGALVAF